MKSIFSARCVFALFGLALSVQSLAQTDDEEALATFKVMKPAVALELALAAMQSCRDGGYQIAVAVVDRLGVTQVMLRDQFAGAHTPETARRKAWTAASFRTDTQSMVEVTRAGEQQAGVRFVEQALMIGGGVPVDAGGSLVGAVGVSGAPNGPIDHDCAVAGIEAVEDKLMF